ncbi:hypothetical protein RB608_11885 [Nocardioides sp. LHD-245]|uniref:hypothetical protein n=1 Tax=Nocardioides sp. LHD-245 TaxID=3051387 RepID=UPI0027E15B34|nr:hypothetical protein [Nocardioides sp. LHD-245]
MTGLHAALAALVDGWRIVGTVPVDNLRALLAECEPTPSDQVISADRRATRIDTCASCGDLVISFGDGDWSHYRGPGSLLNRCQHTVPYGQDATPTRDGRYHPIGRDLLASSAPATASEHEAQWCTSRNPAPPHQRCERGVGCDGQHRDFPTDPRVPETRWTDPATASETPKTPGAEGERSLSKIPPPSAPGTTTSEGATEIEDGFGGYWTTCGTGCDLHVVRPGKTQCNGGSDACPDRPATGVTSSDGDREMSEEEIAQWLIDRERGGWQYAVERILAARTAHPEGVEPVGGNCARGVHADCMFEGSCSCACHRPAPEGTERVEWPPRINAALTINGISGAIVRTVTALVPDGHYRVTVDVPVEDAAGGERRG